MAVFGRGDEEREGTVVVFNGFVEEPRGVPVGEIVLCERVGTVGEALEDVPCFTEEVGVGAYVFGRGGGGR